MARPTNITMCSFCGKSHAEVRKLIAGPGVYICDNCIILCKNVLDRELQLQNQKKQPKFTVPKPAEIKRQLDLYCVGQEHAKKTLAVAVHNHYKRIQPEPVAKNEEVDKTAPPSRTPSRNREEQHSDDRPDRFGQDPAGPDARQNSRRAVCHRRRDDADRGRLRRARTWKTSFCGCCKMPITT